MSSYEKILIGESIPLMEVDDEESDLNYDLISNAEIDADFYDILKYFGTDEFKPLFLNLYNEIISLDFERQRELCEKLNSKITQIFEFEFSPTLSFDNQDDISNFLKFIEFLEYDYIDFLSTLISGLDFELLKKDLDKFLTLYWNTIIKRVNEFKENELILKFLRTNNKEKLYEFIRLRLERDKMLVILKSLEREF
jgi:hypothetical protein